MPHAIWLAHSGSSISVPTVSGCSCRYSSIEPEHLTIAIARQTAGPYSPWGYERLKNKFFVSKFEIIFSCISMIPQTTPDTSASNIWIVFVYI